MPGYVSGTLLARRRLFDAVGLFDEKNRHCDATEFFLRVRQHGGIEELLGALKAAYTIVIVTHNMQQAARISDDAAYMLLGELIEFGETQVLFTRPSDPRTEEYLSGRFG